jgi:hypothetical protein
LSFSKKLLKENNRPVGEYSPNLVTLIRPFLLQLEMNQHISQNYNITFTMVKSNFKKLTKINTLSPIVKKLTQTGHPALQNVFNFLHRMK